MSPWTAVQTVLLAPRDTVPMTRLQGRSLDMMVAGTSASKLARRINEGGRNSPKSKIQFNGVGGLRTHISSRHHNPNFPNGMWCTMREEFASYGFLAVTVASLVLLCSGLLALTFG